MERTITCLACGERGHGCRQCPALNIPPLGEMSKERHDDGEGEEDSLSICKTDSIGTLLEVS